MDTLFSKVFLSEAEPQEKPKRDKKPRRQELEEILSSIFFTLKNDTDFINKYYKLYNEMGEDDTYAKGVLIKKIFNDLNKQFKMHFKLSGIDKSVFKLFPDLEEHINKEFKKAFINVKNKIIGVETSDGL